MHSAKTKLEQGFRETENDIIISAILGVIICAVFIVIFCYGSYFAINVALARRGINILPFNEFIPFFVIGFVVLMMTSKQYQPEVYERPHSRRAFNHAMLGIAMMVPNLVNQNLQGFGDLIQLKNNSYSLDLALEILAMSKKGTSLKAIYDKQNVYSKGQIRLTMNLLEKADFVFVNKSKLEVFTTDTGDTILFEWQRNR
ncbi:hypothetical protein [Candidatus Uabimicrobium amorphum]|uniref:Uncharacterized protein n=1 Tax=Uabimicrobium amorphum TaxID=2596890 RepID=A0A5S9IQ77_UABAM|nr:hypothetical protein [Candidatus Uabimicrobium amorphum]BBM85697.1 hypothetical protein UABAM_04072 [Candidatus Uabimicrobium amorphum]